MGIEGDGVQMGRKMGKEAVTGNHHYVRTVQQGKKTIVRYLGTYRKILEALMSCSHMAGRLDQSFFRLTCVVFKVPHQQLTGVGISWTNNRRWARLERLEMLAYCIETIIHSTYIQ